MDRKTFISALGRITVLAALTTLTGVFISRDKVTLRTGCAFSKQCRGCERLKGCGLPQADKEKENEKK